MRWGHRRQSRDKPWVENHTSGGMAIDFARMSGRLVLRRANQHRHLTQGADSGGGLYALAFEYVQWHKQAFGDGAGLSSVEGVDHGMLHGRVKAQWGM